MIHPVVVSEHILSENRNLISRPEGRRSWPVDIYRLHEHGLYWALALPDGPGAKVKYIRAHVLPELGIQVCRFEWWRTHPYGGYDYYLDIIQAEVAADRWVVRDYYLDLLVWEGKRVIVHDSDEYLAALGAGFMTPDEAEHALITAHTLLNGLGAHGYSLEAYLEAQGVVLRWC